MNKLKRLGNATELEFALARTPIMMVIVLAVVSTVSLYLSVLFSVILALINLIVVVVAIKRIADDNFNGKNLMFCRQFGFTVSEIFWAKTVTVALVAASYKILLSAGSVLTALLPDVYEFGSFATTNTTITPETMLPLVSLMVANAFVDSFTLGALAVALGAYSREKNLLVKKEKAYGIKKMGLYTLIFFYFMVLPIVMKLDFFVNHYTATLIVSLPVYIVFFVAFALIAQRRMRSYITE